MDRDSRRLHRYSPEEKELLEAAYQNSPYLPNEQYEEIAKGMGYTKKQIHSWFALRRSKDERITPRPHFTPAEREILESAFQKNQRPNKAEEAEIARMMNITELKRIHNWFGTRRRSTSNPCAVKRFFNKEQRELLLAVFLKDRNPTDQELKNMAEGMVVPYEKVRGWFTRKRSETARKEAEQEKAAWSANQVSSNPVVTALDLLTINILEDAFNVNPQPTEEELENLRDKTNLDVARIKAWFGRKVRSNEFQRINSKLINQKRIRDGLKEAYQKNKYSTTPELNELAERLGMSRKKVRGWFRYRRTHDKDYKLPVSAVSPLRLRTPEQTMALKQAYQKNMRPSTKEVRELAESLGLKTSQVYNWLQRKRFLEKKCKKIKPAYKGNTLQTLKTAYQKNPWPSTEEKEKLAETAELTVKQVDTWLKSARQRYRCPIPAPRNYTDEQKKILLDTFRETPYPSMAKKKEIKELTGFSTKQLCSWFGEARKPHSRQKKMIAQLEREGRITVKIEQVDDKMEISQLDAALNDNDQEIL